MRIQRKRKGGFIQAILPLAQATLTDLFSGSGIKMRPRRRRGGMAAMAGRIRGRKGGFILNLLKRAVPFVKKIFSKGKKFVKDNPEVVSLAKKGVKYVGDKINEKNSPPAATEGEGYKRKKRRRRRRHILMRRSAGRGIAPVPGPLP